MLHHYTKRFGFTLAEVLITLGIIGVVAALTVSTVIPEIQNRQNIAKWKKEYSVINTAFNEVLADDVIICEHNAYGNCNGGAYTKEFLDAMKLKLKVIDYCGISTDVVPSGKICDNYNEAYWKKYSKYKWSGIANIYSRYRALGVRAELYPDSRVSYNVLSYNFNKLAFLLSDGAVIYFGELWNGPWIVVDVNNAQNGPNEIGRDFFVIHVSSDMKKNRHYLTPAGSDTLFEESPALNNSSYGITGCSKDIGTPIVDSALYKAAGVGCSAKYLME